MSETELKPCPFCGERVTIAEQIDDFSQESDGRIRIECPCGLRFGYHNSVDELAAAWNSRQHEGENNNVNE